MSDDFKLKLINHAKEIVKRAPRASSEQATRQYLILPFFQLLGYDPLNPDEIEPEACASFSDKFRNKVDYVILKDAVPVVAIETKTAGQICEANRGELKGYFNAVSTVKLGILTDGLIYEFFTDTGLENMMDDQPFVRLNLTDVAEERIDEATFDAVLRLRKGVFNPSDVGADAKRKIFIASYTEALDLLLSSPTEDVIRLLMDGANVEGMRTKRLLQEHTPIVKEAIDAFLDKKILERVGFAKREDLVKKPPTPAAELEGEERAVEGRSLEIVTTEVELFVRDHVTRRLAFLSAGDEALFNRLSDLHWVDHKTIYCAYYKQERRGRLFNFREGKDPLYRFEFIDGQNIESNDLSAIDEELLKAFKKRVEELG